jgi:hypothetical protein
MIKKIYLSIFLILILMSSVFLYGCDKPNPINGKQLFGEHDFSIENIKEIGFANSTANDGGTPYGNKTVFAVKKGDERLAGLAEAWENFVEKGVFTATKDDRDFMKTGGINTYVIIFNDNNYISIRIIDENIIQYGLGNLQVSEDLINEFKNSYSVITKEDEIA